MRPRPRWNPRWEHWFLASMLFCPLAAATPPPLNVLFIVVDDWGCTDAGVLGSDFFETPQIDRFAEQSLQFNQAYAAAPVCSPTRAALLTGKVPARLGMTIWHEGAVEGGPKNRRLLPAAAVANLPREETTLAELFRARGYRTAHIGKWHLGKAAFYPETQGFDVNVGGTYWGAPATFFYPYRGVWSAQDPELRYVPVGQGTSGDYLTDRLTDHALRQLRAWGDQPFFLNLWYHSVHTPIEAKPERRKPFVTKAPGTHHRHVTYAGMLASLDENLGRLWTYLRESGLRDRTVVILTSDNGGVDFPSRKSEDLPPTSNAPYRSGKGTLYEGGVRVPLWVRWPGRTRPGTQTQALVSSEDFFPTLATGVLAQEEASLPAQDGVSFLDVLGDAEAPGRRTSLCWHYPHYYPRMTPASAIRSGDWKLIHYYEDERMELYNLRSDVGEAHNLAASEPARVRELREVLDDWRRTVGARAPRVNATYSR